MSNPTDKQIAMLEHTLAVTEKRLAGARAALKDMIIYGAGAYLEKPDGSTEHIPVRSIFKGESHEER